MHRDGIEPRVTSDIATISPSGGSFGGSSLERSFGEAKGDISKIYTLVWNLLSRVNKLEKEVALIKKRLSETSTTVNSSNTRLIWEDDRLKAQVYISGSWHTCIKGGY